MHAIVRMFAPVGWRGWLWRVPVFSAAIVAVAMFVEITVSDGITDGYLQYAKVTTIIALPFVIIALSILQYLVRLQGQLAELATTDLLTGLPNRRAFLDRAARAGGDECGVVLMLDVDHFKRVNDLYGHAVGDACLQEVARRMEELVRREDVVGRLGGEEFGIYLVDAPVEMAREIGERLARGVCVTTAELEEELSVTISVGAVPSQVAGSLAELLARADEALYAAKAAGRARLVLWEEAKHAAA